MKRKGIKTIKDLRRSVKYLLIRLMLFFLRPVQLKSRLDGEPKSIIILAQEKIGDAILLTPLLKNLRRAFPGIEIHLVAFSPVYPFFEGDPHVDVVYRVKQNYLSYFRDIRKKKFDLLYSTKDHPSFTFLYQSRIIPAQFRVGISHPYHKGFFNHLIPLDFHQHVIEKNCALLDFLGVRYAKEDCRPYLPPSQISDEVQSFARKISTLDCIGINLSAGEPEREWSVERWIKFLEDCRVKVIVFAVGERTRDKGRLEAKFDHVIQSPATKSIFEAAHIIQRLRLLVSPDTALIHAASCFEVPIVGLYRADVIHVTRFYPYLTPHELVISPTNRVADISAEKVVQATRKMLSKYVSATDSKT